MRGNFLYNACMNSDTFDIIIIGGGASGLSCACMAKAADNSVLVIERGDRPGKKILSTGNGKCNLTNEYCRVELLDKNPEGIYPYFSSGDLKFVESVISRFNVDDTISFFSEMGVLTENKGGYIYPRSEQASTVQNALRLTCDKKGVRILTGISVDQVELTAADDNYRFLVNGTYRCRKLIVSTGGMAAPKTGSDGSFFKVLKKLGHTIIEPRPALCAVSCSDSFFNELKGVRNSSQVILTDQDGKAFFKSFGNVQFTADGISGIPVFQLSSEFGRVLNDGKIIAIMIDLLPETGRNEIIKMIVSYCDFYGDGYLPPILNSRLLNVIDKQLRSHSFKSTHEFASCAADIIKRFPVTPVSLVSFDEAQTTAGGVSTDEIDPSTLESKIIPGLYFTGEVIDVNGICGGYNLQWAWSTAHIASQVS